MLGDSSRMSFQAMDESIDAHVSSSLDYVNNIQLRFNHALTGVKHAESTKP